MQRLNGPEAGSVLAHVPASLGRSCSAMIPSRQTRHTHGGWGLTRCGFGIYSEADQFLGNLHEDRITMFA